MAVCAAERGAILRACDYVWWRAHTPAHPRTQALSTPSGMRVAPTKDDLQQLCVKAKTLDLPLLLMLFCSKLEREDASNTWQMRLRTLYCLEALGKCNDEELRKESVKLLQGRVPLVEALTNAPEKALAEMARKVSELIRGGAPSHGAAAAASKAGAGGGDGLASLFDGLSVSSGATGVGGGEGGGGGGRGGGDLDALLSFDPIPCNATPARSAPVDLLSQVTRNVLLPAAGQPRLGHALMCPASHPLLADVSGLVAQLAAAPPAQSADLLSGGPVAQHPTMLTPGHMGASSWAASAGPGSMQAHGTGMMSGMGPMLTGGAHGGGMHEVMQASMMSGAGTGPMMHMGGVHADGTPSSMMGAAPQRGMYGMPATAAVIAGNGSYQAGGGMLPGQQEPQPAGAGVASQRGLMCKDLLCVCVCVWPRECRLAFPDLIHPDQIHDVTTNECYAAMPTDH